VEFTHASASSLVRLSMTQGETGGCVRKTPAPESAHWHARRGMWRASRKRIAVVAVLFVASSALLWFCLNLASPWLGIFPERNPVSVTFLAYTNTPILGSFYYEATDAVFEVTNHSASLLICAVTVKAQRGEDRSVFAGTSFLGPHTADRIKVNTPGGGRDWQFQVSLSVQKLRPPWQRRIRAALNRVGLHSKFFDSEIVYAPSTNVLTEPSTN